MESPSLVKAFAMVEALADRGGTASLAELSIAVCVPKPTAHRILHSLLQMGYVDHEPGGAYRLTPKLRWLSLGGNDRRLAAIADPILRSLRSQTGETVNLGVLRRNRVFYVTVIESVHPLRRVAQVQESDPVFCTALGRAIAANLPSSRMEQLLKGAPVEKRTAKTVTDSADLKNILAAVRKGGYAIERDQTDLGVTCIACAVMSWSEPVAAVSLSAPSARVDRDAERRLTECVRAAAESIGQGLASEKSASA